MEEIVYKCVVCNKTFKFNSLYQRHLNKKNPCRNNINFDNNQNIEDINRKYINITQLISDKNKKSVIDKCYFCDKEFSTKGNLIKHKNNACKNYKDLLLQQQNYRELINKLKNKDIEIANLKEENKKLQEENNKIIIADNQPKNIQNNINITNNVTNNNLHIHLNNFGKEDLSHISDEDYIKYIKTLYRGLTKFIKHVHCHEDNPANFNILLEEKNSKNIKVFVDNKWVQTDSNQLISQLKDEKLNILDKKADELQDEQLKNILEANKVRLTNNAEIGRILAEDIKLVLYNHQDAVLENINDDT